MKEYKVCSGFVTCFAQYIATNAFWKVFGFLCSNKFKCTLLIRKQQSNSFTNIGDGLILYGT